MLTICGPTEGGVVGCGVGNGGSDGWDGGVDGLWILLNPAKVPSSVGESKTYLFTEALVPISSLVSEVPLGEETLLDKNTVPKLSAACDPSSTTIL